MPTPKPDPIPNPNPPPRPLPDPAPPPFPSPPGPPLPPGTQNLLWREATLTCFALLLAQSVCFATGANERPEPLPRKVQGFVVLVERDSLVVSVRGFQETFAVSAETKITRNGKPAPLRKLRPRDRVRMTVRFKDEREIAAKIKAHAPLRRANACAEEVEEFVGAQIPPTAITW